MSGFKVTAFSFFAIIAAPVDAAEYLTEVTSEVYQTTGSQRDIAARAHICMAKQLAAGVVNADIFITSDLDQGIIVARSAVEYGSLPTWQIRSRFTFEAREGRFRIAQTNLERFNDMAGGWSPIGKWTGSGWKKAEAAYANSASMVAYCVLTPSKREDW